MRMVFYEFVKRSMVYGGGYEYCVRCCFCMVYYNVGANTMNVIKRLWKRKEDLETRWSNPTIIINTRTHWQCKKCKKTFRHNHNMGLTDHLHNTYLCITCYNTSEKKSLIQKKRMNKEE